jgi:hypothetical protein
MVTLVDALSARAGLSGCGVWACTGAGCGAAAAAGADGCEGAAGWEGLFC